MPDTYEIARIAKAAAKGAKHGGTGIRVEADSALDTQDQIMQVLESLQESGDIQVGAIRGTYSFILPTAAYNPTTRTVALWHFDENTGTSIDDASDNNNDLNLHYTTWTSGKFNYGISLDGSSSYCTATLSSNETIGSYLYIALWINPSGDGPLFTWENVAKLYISSSRLVAEFAGETVQGPPVGTGWQLFHAQFYKGNVYVGVDEIMRLGSVSSTSLSPSAYTIYIGRDGTSYLSGTVDEVLVEADVVVQEDFHVRKYECHPADLGYWTFDDGYGNTAHHGGFMYLPIVLSNCTWGTGYLGSAVVFNGSNSRGAFTPAATTANKLSIELVCKFSDVSSAQTLIDQENGINLEFTGTHLRAQLTGVTNSTTDIAEFSPVADTWYCIDLTYDGSYKTIWLNGQKIGQIAATGTVSIPANPVYIGSTHDGSNYFNGSIDFLTIGKRLLRPYYRPLPRWLIGLQGFEKNEDWVLL